MKFLVESNQFIRFTKNLPNTTKIIIAQRVASVENADKIVVLENGQIASVGTHAQLLKTSEIYKEIYETQTKKEHRHATSKL